MDLSFLDDIAFRAQIIFVVLVIIAAALAGIIVLSYAFILWLKVKNREEKALDYMLLQVAVPRDNEIKIDAAEQFFSSFASLKKSGWKTNITGKPHMTFEIVATPGDIRFYISVPKKLRDFIEKQIYC